MESIKESLNVSDIYKEDDLEDLDDDAPFFTFVWYLTLSCLCVVLVTVTLAAGRMIQIGQKTRTSQQRRTYMGSRQRPSDSQSDPTVFVSPANLPPPPKYGQKTRTSQQRRTYMGSRQRPSDSQSDPTVFVSPANLPPPPKYEAMAPPSYEEVVGVHYPNFQAPVQPINQPITQPITAELAQSSNTTNESDNSANSNANARSNGDVTTSTVVTVMNERTQVTVTAS